MPGSSCKDNRVVIIAYDVCSGLLSTLYHKGSQFFAEYRHREERLFLKLIVSTHLAVLNDNELIQMASHNFSLICIIELKLIPYHKNLLIMEWILSGVSYLVKKYVYYFIHFSSPGWITLLA
jgi:hypothetical protein